MKSIKEERIKRGISQQELADAAGISRTGLSLIENNLTEPKIDTLKKIGKALDIEWEYFVN